MLPTKSSLTLALVVGVLFPCLAVRVAAAEKRPNFLIIAIDDLNDYVGCLGGHPNAITPNLDRLAEEGVLFTHAYCNSPVCNSSRTSLWTGLHPFRTGVISNRSGWFRDRPEWKEVVTIPQALAAAGYCTAGFGKLFHLGSPLHSQREWQRVNTFNYGPRQDPKLKYPHGDKITDWGIPDGNSENAASFDPSIANRVITALEDSYGEPFLIGCGFFRPHTPLYAAQRWFDVHPRAGIILPKTPDDDNADLVYFGKRPRRPQDIEAPGLFSQDWAEANNTWHDVLQAYFACTTAMDHQLGRVLDALAASRHHENTYVILVSDHGWHLGEKRHWGKAALWEQTTRIPLVVAGPGIPKGVRYSQPVDLLSIYPTIMDYADVRAPHQLDGHSLKPVLENPRADRPQPVLTTFVDHYALRTTRWRYIRYATSEEELYDHDVDPDEFNNLAVTSKDSPETIATLKQLRGEMAAMLH